VIDRQQIREVGIEVVSRGVADVVLSEDRVVKPLERHAATDAHHV